MKSALLVIGLVLMVSVSVASVTFGFLAREEARALRVEVEEITIQAEREAETARLTTEFIADLYVREGAQVESVALQEILVRLEGQRSQ